MTIQGTFNHKRVFVLYTLLCSGKSTAKSPSPVSATATDTSAQANSTVEDPAPVVGEASSSVEAGLISVIGVYVRSCGACHVVLEWQRCSCS